MKKLILILSGVFLISTLTGCIEFFEELIVNNNSSGHYFRKLDMSEMMDAMKSFKGLEDSTKAKEKEEEDPAAMGKAMIEDANRLKEIKGVSNVKITEDTVKAIFTLEFDFENDVALNKALN